jgi:hypothetical protein
MSGKFRCDICLKEFSNKYSLKTHIETICKRSQELTFNCLYCSSNFSTKTVLNKHMKICTRKTEYELRNQNTLLTNEIQELKIKLEQLQTATDDRIRSAETNYNSKLEQSHLEYASQIKNIVQNYESKLEELAKKHDVYKSSISQSYNAIKDDNSEKDKKLEYLRGKNKVLQEQVNKLNDKPTYTNTVNNTINNNLYIQNLEPITDELIRKTGESIGIMDLKDGTPGIMRKFHPVLKDRVICTDATRNSLMYNYNGQLKRDTRGQMLTDKIISSAEPQFNIYMDEIDKYYKNLDFENMSDIERSRIDAQYANYRELNRAIQTKGEITKKKISKRISKMISGFSKSKTQFESQMSKIVQSRSDDLPQSTPQTHSHGSVVTDSKFPIQPAARFNKVVSTKQTLINNRIIELHLDEHGNTVKQFRIRSSGLPYLTDEETDPESREQSSSDSETEIRTEVLWNVLDE